MASSLPPKPRIVSSKRSHLMIVASQFNQKYTDALVDSAVDELSDLIPSTRADLIRVPGAFEIPVVTKAVLDMESPSAVIALGVIIRGQTQHADLVARSVTDSLMKLSLEYGRPVIHEVLLLDNEEQAKARCMGGKLNRGIEAARAAAAMIDLMGELGYDPPAPSNHKGMTS